MQIVATIPRERQLLRAGPSHQLLTLPGVQIDERLQDDVVYAANVIATMADGETRRIQTRILVLPAALSVDSSVIPRRLAILIENSLAPADVRSVTISDTEETSETKQSIFTNS